MDQDIKDLIESVQFIKARMATKDDLTELATKSDIAELRLELHAFRTESEADFRSLHIELADINLGLLWRAFRVAPWYSAPMTKTSRKTASTRLTTGRSFVLGRAAFSRVSAVEGITPSKALSDDLRALENELPATRRAVLVGKYGKA